MRLSFFAVLATALAITTFAVAAATQVSTTNARLESDNTVSATGREDAAREIIAAYLNHLGGTEKIQQVKSAEIQGTFELPDMGVSGDLSLIQQGDKFLMRIDIGGLGRFEFGSNGQEVWELNPQSGDRLLTDGDKQDAIRAYGSLVTELEYADPEFAGTLKPLGKEQVGDLECHKIEIDPEVGRTVFAFFDTTTGLLVKTVSTREVQGVEIEVATSYSNFRQVGDLLLPHEFSADGSGQVQVLTYDEIKLNGEIDSGTFTVPEKLRK